VTRLPTFVTGARCSSSRVVLAEDRAEASAMPSRRFRPECLAYPIRIA
jgi:hypothetical protein